MKESEPPASLYGPTDSPIRISVVYTDDGLSLLSFFHVFLNIFNALGIYGRVTIKRLCIIITINCKTKKNPFLFTCLSHTQQILG